MFYRNNFHVTSKGCKIKGLSSETSLGTRTPKHLLRAGQGGMRLVICGLCSYLGKNRVSHAQSSDESLWCYFKPLLEYLEENVLRVEPRWSWKPLSSNSRSREGGWLHGWASAGRSPMLEEAELFLALHMRSKYPQNHLYPNRQHPLCPQICWDSKKQVNFKGCWSFLTLMRKIIFERWNFPRSIVKFLILFHSLMSIWSPKVTPEGLPW